MRGEYYQLFVELNELAKVGAMDLFNSFLCVSGEFRDLRGQRPVYSLHCI